MKEAAVTVKKPAAKKDASTPKQIESIYRMSTEKELGTLKDLVKNISHNGTKPSADSIATELSIMPIAQRASALLGLQRTHGNRYVQRVVAGIQAKLMVSPAGDKYEQEADRVAKQVVQEISTPTVQSVQRQDVKEEEEEELLQGKFETVQRQEPEEEEEELQMKPMVQPLSNGGMSATPELEAAIRQARGSGQPLSDRVRQPMEQAFGADFSGVRVHEDAQSDQLNRLLRARAFTTGKDIFFREGVYNPGSWGGQELIAHELTHVVQQNGGAVQRAQIQARLPSAQQSADSGKVLGQAPEITQRSQPGRIHRCFLSSKTKTKPEPPSLDEVINKGKKSLPKDIADQLTVSSESFSALRERANVAVKEAYKGKKGVEYKPKPPKKAGTAPAYYKEGATYFEEDFPMPMTVLNIIFETANAAQAVEFKRLEKDYDEDLIMDTPYKAYGVDTSELGPLAEEATTKQKKRSLIQEYYEWISLQIARNTFKQLAPKFTSEMARAAWESSFEILLGYETFMEYYNEFGKTHRKAVEATLV
jgi:hypothetical protein